MRTVLTYSFANIIRRLGCDGGERKQIAYVQELVDDFDFPAPFPTKVKGKPGLTRQVRFSSRWSRDAVDAWFHDFNPPHVTASIERLAEAEAADRLDNHCETLSFLKQAA